MAPVPIKYIVFPGYIKSRTDGDIHYITFMQLCRLYNVNPSECLNASNPKQAQGRRGLKLIELHPRYDGKYMLPLQA